MSTSRKALIDRLAADAAAPTFPRGRLAALWTCATLLLVVVAVPLVGPLRGSALSDLVSAPRFSLEMGVGIAAFVGATSLAFSLAVPGRVSRWLRRLGWSVSAAWLVLVLLGFVAAPLEPSMLDKRSHCFVEVLAYGGLAAVAGLWLLARGFVLEPVEAALAIGVAAVLPGTLAMQLGCIYEPAHNLLFHVAPGALVAVMAGLLGWRWLRR